MGGFRYSLKHLGIATVLFMLERNLEFLCESLDARRTGKQLPWVLIL